MLELEVVRIAFQLSYAIIPISGLLLLWKKVRSNNKPITTFFPKTKKVYKL